MTGVRRLLLCSAALLLAMSQAGCPPRSGDGSSPTVPSSGPGGSNGNQAGGTNSRSGSKHSNTASEWPYWPVSMRVHPLTRLTSDPHSGQALVECRLEFMDSDGQTSRAVGQLTLQLYPDSATPTGSGAMETWNQDLRDRLANRQQYDDVTRTYLFRLQLTQPPPAGCEVRAFFLSSDGQRLSATMRLRQ